MPAQTKDISFYFLSLFSFFTIANIALYGHTSWLVPLFLVAWSFLCLFRLLVLTTPYDGLSGTALPRKILATLGFKKQEQREELLGRIFLHPLFVFFLAGGALYLGVEFLYSSIFMNDHLTAVFSGPRAVVNVESGSLFLSLQPIFFPFLCGLMFTMLCSHALNEKLNQSIAFIFMMFFIILSLVVGWYNTEVGSSGYLQRAFAGGFWMASLPYILGFFIVSIPVKAFFDGFLNCWPIGLANIMIFSSMAAVDMSFALSFQSQALMLCGWAIVGFLNGPVMFETQGQYAAYRNFKEKLDFGTKVEHC